MSKVSTRTISTPGQAPAEPQTDTTKPDAFEAVVRQTGMEGDDADPGESEVDRLMRVVQAQQSQIEALTGAVQNLARNSHGNGSTPGQSESLMPDAADVNLATLKAPLLTRQGWLVPPDYGMDPLARQEAEDQRMMRAAMQKIAEKA